MRYDVSKSAVSAQYIFVDARGPIVIPFPNSVVFPLSVYPPLKLLHPLKPARLPSVLNVRVIDWVLEITGIFPDPPVAIIAPLYVQVPINAASETGGGVVATVATVVGTGVGTVVAGGGTGVGDVQPAARIPTNRTAQTKNSKDFILTEYHHLLFIPTLLLTFSEVTRLIRQRYQISLCIRRKNGPVIAIVFTGLRNYTKVV